MSRSSLSLLLLTLAFLHGTCALLRVLVVGAGSISTEYAMHHFVPDATDTTVIGIVDTDLDKAARLAAKVGIDYYFSSLDQAFEKIDDQVDVVYIGTTPKSHRSLVQVALQHDKHVLLEKPIACTMEDADAIVALADQRNTVVAMNIGMRYNEALRQLKQRVLVNNELGTSKQRPEQLRAVLRTHFEQWPRPWQMQPWCAGRDEGGPLREVGTHFLFALLEFAGAHDETAPPVTGRVRATVVFPSSDEHDTHSELRPCETEASGSIELHGGLLPPGGLVVELSVRTDAPTEFYELTIAPSDSEEEQETNKSLSLFNFGTLLLHQHGETEVLVEDAPYGRWECVHALVAAADSRQEKTCASDFQSIVTVRQGRNAQQLLEAIYNSNGAWVQVQFG